MTCKHCTINNVRQHLSSAGIFLTNSTKHSSWLLEDYLIAVQVADVGTANKIAKSNAPVNGIPNEYWLS